MIHVCCTACRLRLAPPATERAPCPICGVETLGLEAEHAMGYRRYRVDAPTALAAEAALDPPGSIPPASV